MKGQHLSKRRLVDKGTKWYAEMVILAYKYIEEIGKRTETK